MIKDDKAKTKETLLNLIAIICHLPLLLAPFVPEAMERLASFLGQPNMLEPTIGETKWHFSLPQTLTLSSSIKPLFEKIEETTVAEERQRLKQKGSE